MDHQPKFICRYVDNCFATFADTFCIDVFLCNINSVHNYIQFTKEVAMNVFLCNINSVHNYIQFTKEVEMNDSLAFLYIFSEKSDNGLKTSSYRNPITTGHFTKVGGTEF